MPPVVAAFLVAISPILYHIAFRIAVGMGFGIASYIGIGVLMADAIGHLTSQFTGLPAVVLDMVYLLGIDRCVNLLMSAYTARLSLLGMTALGAMSRMIQVPESGS